MPKHEWKVNYAYQKSISYSQYSIYSQCNYRWYLEYIKKQRIFKPGINLTFGTSFHETLQEYLRIMFEESVKKSEEFNYAEYLKERMFINYKEDLANNKNEHFIKQEEFESFIQDGENIMDWLKKNRSKYFSTKSDKLIGIEIPIEQFVVDSIPNVIMIGSIDLIFYSKATNKYTIIDIKTSTRGWNDDDKKDKLKINQLLFYKSFYARALKIPVENVEVKFLVVKRRPFISEEFPTKWVQEIMPAQGTKKLKDALSDLESFVTNCFTPEAKYVEGKEYQKNFDGCKYCPFKDKDDLCTKK
ncbi:MAG: PD-(D/E)XK nuclease family protein [bacterium]